MHPSSLTQPRSFRGRSHHPASGLTLGVDGLSQPHQMSEFLAAPEFDPPLQRAQLTHVINTGILGHEARHQLERRLTGIGLQTVAHFHPMGSKGIGASSSGARFREPVSAFADHDPAGPGVLAPLSHSPGQCAQLSGMKAPGILHAQLIEELGGKR